MTRLPLWADYQDVRGAVLLELAQVLCLFLILLAGMVDFFFIMRERFILSEAARSALRIVITAPPFEFNPSGTRDDLPTQQQKYVRDRYQRAVYMARYLVAADGLKPDNYNYNIFDTEWPDPAGRDPYHTVQLNVSARASARRFFVFPRRVFKACVGISGIIGGVVLPQSFAIADPAPDPDCQPQGEGA